jgi:hypothetical protein
MPTRFWKTVRGLLGLLVLAATGCSREPSMTEVSGTVRLNGKPMAKARVEFMPDPGKGTTGRTSFGYTDESGHFTLATYTTNVRGAVVGNHRVLVRDESIFPATRAEAQNPKNWGKRRWSIRYEDVSQTPLHKEVKPGPPQTIDLDVTGAP